MANVKVLNILGEECGKVKLDDKVFGQEYNEALIHQVVVAYLANNRQGTKSTLTRSEVRGHAKKPWRQKGTGRARQGSTKAPQWRGGGVAFAPKPRDFSKKVNKEAKKVAFKSAISQKLANGEIIIVDKIELTAGKTKEVVNMLNNLHLNKSVMFVTKGANDNLLQGASNLQKIGVTTDALLNVYDIVSMNNLVITLDAVKSIEEAYLA